MSFFANALYDLVRLLIFPGAPQSYSLSKIQEMALKEREEAQQLEKLKRE